MFEPYLERWALDIDGEPIVTQFSRLLPVRYRDRPAMLKLLLHDEERTGSEVLAWWDGEGAVRVFDREGDGLLLERATGSRSLATMAREGQDDEATRILCDVAVQLHAPRPAPLPMALPTLTEWFSPLSPAAAIRPGILTTAQHYAEKLLAAEREVTILHGDLHHDNVLDGGERGWLAIDPKGLIGERTFDFVNILRNPMHFYGDDQRRLSRQAEVVAESASLDKDRLLEWTVSFCGLSAAWILSEPNATESAMQEATGDLALCQAALTLLE